RRARMAADATTAPKRAKDRERGDRLRRSFSTKATSLAGDGLRLLLDCELVRDHHALRLREGARLHLHEVQARRSRAAVDLTGPHRLQAARTVRARHQRRDVAA